MPDLSDFASRDDYYAALDDHFARLYGEPENDCE